MYGLNLAVSPTHEPVSQVEAKSHLRVEHDDDNADIESTVTAARAWVEEYTRRALVTQTLALYLDAFPPDGVPIRLPRNPVQSISSIQYVDENGDTQTLSASAYRLDNKQIVARITPASGYSWPGTDSATGAVIVTFVAGYGDAGDVPQPIRQAIKLLLGVYYENRDFADPPRAAEFLLGPYRIIGALDE